MHPELEKIIPKNLGKLNDEGMYQFGTRQIHMKLNSDHEVVVRVGGGYVPFSTFAKKYGRVEVIKKNKFLTGS